MIEAISTASRRRSTTLVGGASCRSRHHAMVRDVLSAIRGKAADRDLDCELEGCELVTGVRVRSPSSAGAARLQLSSQASSSRAHSLLLWRRQHERFPSASLKIAPSPGLVLRRPPNHALRHTASLGSMHGVAKKVMLVKPAERSSHRRREEPRPRVRAGDAHLISAACRRRCVARTKPSFSV